MRNFYSIPTAFSALRQKKRLEKRDVAESIDQHIRLILVTRFGEFRYNPDYGCVLWEYDFEILPKMNAWRNEIEQSIAKTLDQLEPRLGQVMVRVRIDLEPSKSSHGKVVRIKRRILISVKGVILSTNESFERDDYLIYFSPISLD
jgi:phage baseplate assembly protein W